MVIVVKMRLKKTLKMVKFLMKRMKMKSLIQLNKIQNLKYLKKIVLEKEQKKKILNHNGIWYILLINIVSILIVKNYLFSCIVRNKDQHNPINKCYMVLQVSLSQDLIIVGPEEIGFKEIKVV